jgi:hypothetical protein
MELDDLKSTWQQLNQKLDQQNALNLQILREAKLEKAKHGLRPLVWGQGFQMLLGLLLAIFSADFWIEHRHIPHLLFTGLLMHAYGLAMIIFGARMQFLIHHIDYSAPVLSIQKQLAKLRRFFVLGGLGVGLPWWVLWIPLMAMIFAKLGVDIFVHAPLLIWINLVACMLGILLTLLFLRWAKGRPKLFRALENTAAGHSLNKAQARLDEIARFEEA